MSTSALLPDLPAIRPRRARSVKRLQERDGPYGPYIPNSTLTRRLRDIITKGKLDGRGVEIQQLICRAMRASIDLDRLGERTGSIVTFCRRTAVLVPQQSRAAQSVLAGIEQVFSVLSHVEVSTGGKKQPFTPAETKSSLCHHAFVGEIRCDPPILRPELVSLEEL